MDKKKNTWPLLNPVGLFNSHLSQLCKAAGLLAFQLSSLTNVFFSHYQQMDFICGTTKMLGCAEKPQKKIKKANTTNKNWNPVQVLPSLSHTFYWLLSWQFVIWHFLERWHDKKRVMFGYAWAYLKTVHIGKQYAKLLTENPSKEPPEEVCEQNGHQSPNNGRPTYQLLS